MRDSAPLTLRDFLWIIALSFIIARTCISDQKIFCITYDNQNNNKLTIDEQQNAHMEDLHFVSSDYIFGMLGCEEDKIFPGLLQMVSLSLSLSPLSFSLSLSVSLSLSLFLAPPPLSLSQVGVTPSASSEGLAALASSASPPPTLSTQVELPETPSASDLDAKNDPTPAAKRRAQLAEAEKVQPEHQKSEEQETKPAKTLQPQKDEVPRSGTVEEKPSHPVAAAPQEDKKEFITKQTTASSAPDVKEAAAAPSEQVEHAPVSSPGDAWSSEKAPTLGEAAAAEDAKAKAADQAAGGGGGEEEVDGGAQPVASDSLQVSEKMAEERTVEAAESKPAESAVAEPPPQSEQAEKELQPLAEGVPQQKAEEEQNTANKTEPTDKVAQSPGSSKSAEGNLEREGEPQTPTPSGSKTVPSAKEETVSPAAVDATGGKEVRDEGELAAAPLQAERPGESFPMPDLDTLDDLATSQVQQTPAERSVQPSSSTLGDLDSIIECLTTSSIDLLHEASDSAPFESASKKMSFHSICQLIFLITIDL